MHRPCGLCISPEPDFLFYVGELGPSMPFNRDHPHLGPRISILTHKGELLARLGDGGLGHQPDQFIAPHGMAVDGRGDVYVGEVSNTTWPLVYPERPLPKGLRVLRKLVRL